MKKLIPTIGFAIIIGAAQAGPSCTGECANYIWNSANNAFICSADSCTCKGTTTYPCYNPCIEEINCGETRWSAHSTGYQKGTYTRCSLDTSTGMCDVTETTKYRCAAGYYGSSSNGTSGCTRCPSSGGVYGTSVAGSTTITSCYLPSGTTLSFSDTKGSGTETITSNCYYSN